MWRRILTLGIICLSGLSAGCSALMNKGGVGLIYTDTIVNYAVTAQANMKRGEACSSSILGLIATGDASAGAAAKAGGIVSIGAVDEEAMSILGIYAKHCTIVHGK